MMIRTLASAAALSIAMLASGALAQSSINGVAIPADELPKVQAQCDILAADAAKADGATNTESADPNEGEPDTPAETAAGTTVINLETLTLDQCKEAGLVK